MRFFLLFFLAAAALFPKEKVDFLFYLHDAGETAALLPALESLEERGFSVALLAGGAAEKLAAGHPFLTIADFGGKPPSGRGEKIGADVLVRLKEEIDPKAVVAGVAYESQGQVLDLYRGRPALAFWDNFNSDGENPYFSTARSVAQRASVLLLPSAVIEGDFTGPFEKKVVGQPTVDRWRREMKQGSGPSLFIGGYGKDYEEAFDLFLDCAALLGEPCFVQIHPKTDGSFERGRLSRRPGLNVRISEEKSTLEAVGGSALILCHQSTAAFQALACGKPVVHIIPEGQGYESLPLDKGLALRASSPEQFLKAIELAKPVSSEAFDQLMGIPPCSAERLLEALIEEVSLNLSQKKIAKDWEGAAALAKKKAASRGDLPYATVQRQLDLIDQLAEFELGRFFLLHQGGLNGYWTHYILTQRQSDHPLESFLLNRAPVAKATQQRFQIFQEIIQSHVREGASFASIPSGLMGDLLFLNYPVQRIALTGIDLDPDALEQAKALAEEKGLSRFARFIERDAWKLGIKEEFDLIASNGLNIYEPSDERVAGLCRQFHAALKEGGILVTSFLTPPPGINHRCEWDMGKISMEDLLLQKIIAADILEARWQSYRTPERMVEILESAGFSDLQIHYDAARIFPTVTAKKSFRI